MRFGRSKDTQPEQEPVRPDQVHKLAKLMQDLDDTVYFDEQQRPGGPYRQAKAALDAAKRNSTAAEIRAGERMALHG
ncbi:hypothetical protein [Saccharopolyspora taberi]|uniref:Uncharacterized protein n=1 Tax=Saccharopolyspora taberi TaxID=60895 RepID=A0ABN3V4W1_9PSEU